MKKLYTAALAATVALAASAEVFDATAWGNDNVNNVNVAGTEFEYAENGSSLTVSMVKNENNGMARCEIGNKTTLTLGGANTIAVFKVTYTNGEYINYNQNMIYVRRQLRNTVSAGDDTEYLAPYFITDQTKNAGRIAANNKTTDTEAYYWRYLPGLPTVAANTKSAPDWSKEFTLPSSFANNSKTSVDGEDAWGFSVLGIRIVHSADDADAQQGMLPENPKVTFNYVGLTSPEKLGFASADEFNEKTSAQQGAKVKAYIEDVLTNTTALIDVVGEKDVNAPAEYFTLAGVRVAQPTAGLYIVRRGNTVSKELVK